MLTIITIFCLALTYIIIGYMVGIVRYRFARSKAVQAESWRKAWQAWLFYPTTRAQKIGHSFELASQQLWGGPIGGDRPVLNMKSHDYVSLLMFIWGPLFLFMIVQHVYLTTVATFRCLGSLIEKMIYFCITLFRKAINRSLPEDIRVPETQIVLVASTHSEE